MFEGIKDFVPISRSQAVSLIQRKGISIIHQCCSCQRRIETIWLDDELDGLWMALDTNFSEVFSGWVADPNLVVCNHCFINGTWRKKGIKVK